MTLLQLLGGLILLGFGGDLLIRGAVAVAEKLGVSKLFIGLVLVGFGTSIPELATSIQAGLAGSPGIAIGNVVGSNIANILLILGITAVLTSIKCERSALIRDGLVMLGATAALCAFAITGELNRTGGVLFVGVLASYVGFAYLVERHNKNPVADLHVREASLLQTPHSSLYISLVIALCGGAMILIGANLMVMGAVIAARQLDISETVIGLTIVAVGTSLPELVASITAARRGETDLAFGNIVGSNIFNILGILGVTVIITPIQIPANIIRYDLGALMGASVLLFVFAWTGRRISRWEGLLFIILYSAYLGLLLQR